MLAVGTNNSMQVMLLRYTLQVRSMCMLCVFEGPKGFLEKLSALKPLTPVPINHYHPCSHVFSQFILHCSNYLGPKKTLATPMYPYSRRPPNASLQPKPRTLVPGVRPFQAHHSPRFSKAFGSFGPPWQPPRCHLVVVLAMLLVRVPLVIGM